MAKEYANILPQFEAWQVKKNIKKHYSQQIRAKAAKH